MALNQQSAQTRKEESEKVLGELKTMLRAHDPNLDDVIEVALRQERQM